MRSEISITSSSRCDTKMKAARVRSSRTRWNNRPTSCLDSTEVGSSRRMTRAPPPPPPTPPPLPPSTAPPPALPERQPLRELDHLALRERKRRGRGVGVDVQVHLGQLPPRRLGHALPADHAEVHELLLEAQEDVLHDRQARDQRLLLEHHADARLHGLARIREPGGPPVHQHLA